MLLSSWNYVKHIRLFCNLLLRIIKETVWIRFVFPQIKSVIINTKKLSIIIGNGFEFLVIVTGRQVRAMIQNYLLILPCLLLNIKDYFILFYNEYKGKFFFLLHNILKCVSEYGRHKFRSTRFKTFWFSSKRWEMVN